MSLRLAIQEAADRGAELAVAHGEGTVTLPKPERIGVGFVIAPFLAQQADAWTTIIGLRKGYEEANPFMRSIAQHQAAFLALKLTAGLGLAWGTKVLAEKGNVRAAKATSVIGTFFGVAPAAMNLRTMGAI